VTLLPFLAVTLAATGAALFARGRPRLALAIGLVGLVAALVTALAIAPDDRLEIGGAVLVTSEFLRLFLVLGCVSGLCLAVVGVAAGTRRDAPAVTLGTLASIALATALADVGIAVIAITAGGLLGVLVTIVPTAARTGATIGIRELRAVIVAGALAIVAVAWIGPPFAELAAPPVLFGLAYLGFVIAVALRFGAIPFHVWAARLADAAPEVTLPVITAWGPAAFAVIALAWIDSTVAPTLPDLGPERAVLIAIGIASIVLAALAATIQDDLEHVLGYSIVGDAGVILLALAVLDPAVWAPARLWIIAYIVARSAFAAWVAAIRTTFWTGRIEDLRGWALRAPVLAVALVLILGASVGLPGLAAFEARASIVGGLFDGAGASVVLATTFLPIVYYGRLLAVGLRRPFGPRSGPEARARLHAVDLTNLGGSLADLGRQNRVPVASALTVLLAIAALTASAGGFGIADAAEDAPPTTVVGSP
jgi:formate hydrogenlyase subunit 3/multisubunit Na+/H+ antiporter MnhD subunit